MRILLVSHSSNFGGTEVCFDRALRHLVGAGHEVLAAYPEGAFASAWESVAPRLSYAGSVPPTFRVKGYAGWLLRTVRQAPRLATAVRQAQPDVIVAFSSVVTTPVLVGWLTGVPVVCTVREAISPAPVRRLLWRFLAWRCARLVAVSRFLLCALEPFAPGRVSLVPDGVPIVEDKGQPGGGRPVVACYAGYARQKGGDVFVRAAQVVHEAQPEVRFRYFGSVARGQQVFAEELHRLVECSGLDGVFEFCEGFDFVKSYPEASVVVVPSRTEGLGLVALEAMAAGVPVVAADVGGLRDVVADSDTGARYPVEDYREGARRVLELLTDEILRARTGVAARARVESQFSLAASLEGLERELKGVVKGRVIPRVRRGG